MRLKWPLIRPRRLAAALLALSIGLGGQTAVAENVDPEARRLLEASTRYLAAQTRFTVDIHSTIEAVLHSGQKLQFDNAIAIAVRRPDALYAERLGELVGQEFFYDGRTLTLHNLDNDVYATLPAPSTIEGMLDFARETLDIVAPASDLVYRDAFEILMEDVTSGFVVGNSVVDGVRCDHVAFRKPHVDFQVWIQQGSSPLPRRFVITSRDVVNAPQYMVEMRRWDLAPVLTDDTFRFSPPDGAQQIEFLTLDGTGR